MKKNLLFIIIFAIGLSSVHSQLRILEDAARKAAEAAGIDEKTTNRLIKTAATLEESRKAADNLTPENEYYLGRAVAANIAGTYGIYKNPALEAYLNKICSAIVINSPRPDIYNGYHVAILDTNEINAFATPGGHIFLTRGLIACAGNEDALAAVIAHEVAHIQLRHALTSIRNARYANAFISEAFAVTADNVGGVKEFSAIMGDSVNDIVTTMVVKGFSPAQEKEADAAALALLASAGYEPSGIIEMLEAIRQKQGNAKTGFGKTHPSPAERITAVKKIIGKHKVEDTRNFRTKRFSDITR